MKNKTKKRLLCVVLSVTSLFSFASCTGKFNRVYGDTIEYNGSVYRGSSGTTGPYIASLNSTGTRIGYLWYPSIFFVFLRVSVDMFTENILASYGSSSGRGLWIKEGYEFPDLSEVTIKDIDIVEDVSGSSYIGYTYTERKLTDFSGKRIARDDLVDQDACLMPDEMKAGVVTYGKTLYCNINEIENIAFRMELYFNNGEPYLGWSEYQNDFADSSDWVVVARYKVREEYRDIFRPLYKD